MVVIVVVVVIIVVVVVVVVIAFVIVVVVQMTIKKHKRDRSQNSQKFECNVSCVYPACEELVSNHLSIENRTSAGSYFSHFLRH